VEQHEWRDKLKSYNGRRLTIKSFRNFSRVSYYRCVVQCACVNIAQSWIRGNSFRLEFRAKRRERESANQSKRDSGRSESLAVTPCKLLPNAKWILYYSWRSGRIGDVKTVDVNEDVGVIGSRDVSERRYNLQPSDASPVLIYSNLCISTAYGRPYSLT